jgi:hypothetical protein
MAIITGTRQNGGGVSRLNSLLIIFVYRVFLFLFPEVHWL